MFSPSPQFYHRQNRRGLTRAWPCLFAERAACAKGLLVSMADGFRLCTEVVMLGLFLRRADRPGHVARQGLPRLTVECPREALQALRRQICLDFSSAGLSVERMQVGSGSQPDLASACVTVDCPPGLGAELMVQAARLSHHPAVRQVRLGAMPAL